MSESVVIDGSAGEGGGQIVRLAVALAQVSGRSVRVDKIRAGRKRSGLKRQHIAAIRGLVDALGSQVAGLELGSESITYNPAASSGPIDIDVDIGSAGSITLVLQALLPVLLHSKEGGTAHVVGGSDVPFSPPLDHTREVLLPVLERISGRSINLHLDSRGYNPAGGGEVRIGVGPFRREFVGLNWLAPQDVVPQARIHLSHLPRHVAKRISSTLRSRIPGVDPEVALGETQSPGTGVILWSSGDDGALGASALGRRGVSAEKVASGAMEHWARWQRSGATLDPYLADQVVPYLTRAAQDGSSTAVVIPEASSHLETALDLARNFYEFRSTIEPRENGFLWELDPPMGAS